MKYLVVSDFHIPERAREIPKEILQAAKEADGVICAGDFTTREVYEVLKRANKSLIAVRGNCDSFELPDYAEFEVVGTKIGVAHSHRFGRGNIEALFGFAKTKKLDVLVFGHTHTPFLEMRKGILLLNPGSVSGVPSGWGESAERTYALLEVCEKIEARIIGIS
ncbi:MAG: YfcE family phosphodiesterase [Candidatus Aenigmatarchaeota archaeon]